MKRTPLVITICALVLLGGGAYWYLALGGSSAISAATGGSHGATATAAQREAAGATQALRKLTTDPGSLVPKDQKSTVSTTSAVPAGSTLKVSEKSWTPASPKSGTLIATLSSPGLPDATYVVSMLNEGGRWVVVGTIPEGN